MLCNKKWSLISLSLIVAATMFSCKNSPTGSSLSSDDVVGKWIIDRVGAKGTMSFAGMSMSIDTVMNATNNNSYFLFYADNSYTATMDESLLGDAGMMKRKTSAKILQTTSDTGTWSLSGNQLSMNSLEDDTTIVTQIAINGTSMNMTISINETEEGMTMNIKETFYMTKE